MKALCQIYGLILETIMHESKDLRRPVELYRYEKSGQDPERDQNKK